MVNVLLLGVLSVRVVGIDQIDKKTMAVVAINKILMVGMVVIPQMGSRNSASKFS